MDFRCKGYSTKRQRLKCPIATRQFATFPGAGRGITLWAVLTGTPLSYGLKFNVLLLNTAACRGALFTGNRCLQLQLAVKR